VLGLGDTVHIDSLKREKKTFGFTRLNFYEMIELLIRLEYYIVVDTLIDDSVAFFPAACDAFFAYEHSTFNHRSFEAILNLCLQTQPADIILKVCRPPSSSRLPLPLHQPFPHSLGVV
jgi:hypothetical protein